MSKRVIHIFGASGSGTTTLGAAIARETGWTHLDSDDYFWMPIDPPFTTKRPVEERVALMQKDIDAAENVVISGSLVDWGDALKPQFTLCIRTVLDPAVRMDRLQRREYANFGARIEPGGDMYEQNQKFLRWAERYDDGPPTMRTRALHDQWQATLNCPVIVLDTRDELQTLIMRLKGQGVFD